MGRVKLTELAEDAALNDYRIKRQEVLQKHTEIHFRKHLTPFSGHRRASLVSTADIRKFIDRRQKDEASNGEINRELSLLRRSFNLAKQSGKLMQVPHIPMLKENNVRTGLFEPEQFKSVHKHLPDYLKPVSHFAYLTGWRKSEISNLELRQADFVAGRVALDPGTTKNDEGRVISIHPGIEGVAQKTGEIHIAAPTRGG